MVLKVAEGFVDMGETREEKENYLRSACTAWNIACLPPLKRESAIKQHIERCRKMNKTKASDCKAIEENIRLLIKQKDKLYPDVNVQIVSSSIDRVGRYDRVTLITAKTS